MMTHIIKVKCLRCSGQFASLGFVPGHVYWADTDGEFLTVINFDGERSHDVIVAHRQDGIYGSKSLRFRDVTDCVDDAQHDREQLEFAWISLKRMAVRLWKKVTKR